MVAYLDIVPAIYIWIVDAGSAAQTLGEGRQQGGFGRYLSDQAPELLSLLTNFVWPSMIDQAFSLC